MPNRLVAAAGAGLLIVVLVAAGVAASEPTSEPAPEGDNPNESDSSFGSTPQTRIAPPLEDRPEPGFDVEGGPISEGEELRRLTQLTEAEVEARDPEFKHWVELIRSGQADKRVMRLYWFFRSRLDPFDAEIPEGWRQQGAAVLRDEQKTREAVARFDEQRRRREALRGEQEVPPDGSVFAARDRARETTSADAPGPGVSTHGVWVPIGPFDIPGRMTGLDRPAGDPNTLYASAADGGVWRTRDGGQTWEPLSDFEPTLSGGAVLLDPSDPNVIYFGTGEGNGSADNYPGIGVFRSADVGRTWTASNNFSSTVRALAMHPSEPNRVYAAGDAGCYVSDDAGATFTLMGGGLTQAPRGHAVKIRPDDPNTVYCTIQGTGVFRSIDHAATWTRLDGGLPPESSGGRIVLAMSQSDPDILIAGYDIDGGTIYRTEDGGDTWIEVAGIGIESGYCFGQCWYDNVVGIDPANPDILYAGGINTYGSLDAGANWTQISSSAGGRGAPNYVHIDQHFVFTPAGGEVFLANDGGIFRSTDNGSNWTEWSQGIDTTQYYGICRHPSNTGWAFGGTQDNGSHRRREGDDPEWVRLLGGDGGMCMTGPDGTNIIVGEYQNHNMQRSTNDGLNWSSATAGIGAGEPRPWVGLIVADPTDRNNMWTVTDRVYRSTDARLSPWVAISEPLYDGVAAGALEVAPSDSNIVYVGFGGGGIAAAPNGLDPQLAWKKTNQEGLPNRTVRRIRAHPDNAATAYAVFSGYGSERIWKSTDRGLTWANHTGDLPDVPVNDLLVDGDNPGTLIAATDLGVFRSDDDGATWYGFSVGLPTVASIEMTLDRVSGRLRVGTHGRSMWEWRSSSTGPVAVPDGATIPGEQVTVDRIGDTQMRVHWDVSGCTAWDYHLLYGDLEDVADRNYIGSECTLGTAGQTDIPLPNTPSGSAFFVIVGTNDQGAEGPHGFTTTGQPLPANGIGLCTITTQDPQATCP